MKVRQSKEVETGTSGPRCSTAEHYIHLSLFSPGTGTATLDKVSALSFYGNLFTQLKGCKGAQVT